MERESTRGKERDSKRPSALAGRQQGGQGRVGVQMCGFADQQPAPVHHPRPPTHTYPTPSYALHPLYPSHPTLPPHLPRCPTAVLPPRRSRCCCCRARGGLETAEGAGRLVMLLLLLPLGKDRQDEKDNDEEK